MTKFAFPQSFWFVLLACLVFPTAGAVASTSSSGVITGTVESMHPDGRFYHVEVTDTVPEGWVAQGEVVKIMVRWEHIDGKPQPRPEETEVVRGYGLGDTVTVPCAASAMKGVYRITDMDRVETALEDQERLAAWRHMLEPVPMDKPLQPPAVTGTTYYVAKAGDNDEGDGSKSNPWRTIKHGMQQLQPGDCLLVREGVYEEAALEFANSGKPGQYITVAGYPGEKAVIDAGGSRWAFRVRNKDGKESRYLVFRDFEIRNIGHFAVGIGGEKTSNVWVCNNDIHTSATKAPMIVTGTSLCVISNNRIHDSIGNAFLLYHGRDCIVEWNEIYNTSRQQDDAGAVKWLHAPGGVIRYNTVKNCYRSETATEPGWAPKTPENPEGDQWRFLQGVTGIYLDFARNEAQPDGSHKVYIYGNHVEGCNAGIYVYFSDAEVFDNVCVRNGRTSKGGWVEGKEGGKWLPFVGPYGHGLATAGSNVVFRDNVSIDNEKFGLGLWKPKGRPARIYDNLLAGNGVSQLKLDEISKLSMGYNTLMPTPGTDAIRVVDKTFPDFEAFGEAFPGADIGSAVKPVAADELDVDAVERQVTFDAEAWDAFMADAEDRYSRQLEKRYGKKEPYQPDESIQIGEPWPIPGTIEAEHYDGGGPTVSYQDTTGGNEGEAYRQDDVDIKKSDVASNGYVVGWGMSDEWLDYTVDVKEAGTYTMVIRCGTAKDDRRLHLSSGGKDITGPISVPNLGAWDQLTEVTVPNVKLDEGQQVLRLHIDVGPADIDCMTFTR